MTHESELHRHIEELQMLEQNIQQFLSQRQTVQVELNEVANALDELGKARDEVYRIVGGVMIRSSKEEIGKDLAGRQKQLEARMSAIEKQELLLQQRAADLRKTISGATKKK